MGGSPMSSLPQQESRAGRPWHLEMHQSIVITGAGGMLGHALADLVVQSGTPAVVLDRARLDVANEQSLRDVFREHRPTLLLNCAAHTKVDLCEEQKDLADTINGHAVGHLAKLSREFGTYLVHVSTDYVFDGRGTRPYRRDDPVAPQSAYGRSKLLGERLLRENAPAKWLIVRTAWVYGRHGANFPRTMVTAARAGKPLKVVNDQVGSPTYAPDLAHAILDLVDRNATGIYHVTNSGQTNWFEFAKATLEEFSVTPSELAPTTTAEWFKIRPNSANRPAYSVLNMSDFERTTGRVMRPWRDALRDFRAAVDQFGF